MRASPSTSAPAGSVPRGSGIGYIPNKEDCVFTAKWSKHRLDTMRELGDPIADAVVRELHETTGLTNIYNLLGAVMEKAETDGGIFSTFKEQNALIPSWVDFDLIEEGQRVFATYSPFMHASLLCGSLVGGSNFTNAAITTLMAGNIGTDPTRRIDETGVLIAQLALVGTLRPGGEAHIAFSRIRLLHAGLRHWLVSSGRYQRTDEVPINQHDLAITLGVFAYQNLRSLRRMNVVLHRHENEAYMHMWRYCGWILGINEDILPLSFEDQEAFFLASLKHQAHPELIPERETKQFLDAFAKQASDNSYLPFSFTQTLLYQLTLFLNGAEWCEGMKIEYLGDSHWSVRLFKASGMVFGTLLPRYAPFFSGLMLRTNSFLIRREVARHASAGKGMSTGASKPKDVSKGLLQINSKL